MSEKKMDTSPYRPMADSRWGDIIDVLTDEASTKVLEHYDVLILGGPVKVTGTLQKNIEAFVRQGGTLVWAAGMACPEHAPLTGVTMQPEFRVGRAWSSPGKDSTNEPYLYFPSELNVKAKAEILIRTHNGSALIVRNTVGKGKVYTCLSPWYASEKTPLSGFALKMLDIVMDTVQPVQIEGIPVQWCTTRSADARTIAIANHSGETWRGTVQVRDLSPRMRYCRQSRHQKPLTFKVKDGIARVELSIPAYDVAVIRWSTKRLD